MQQHKYRINEMRVFDGGWLALQGYARHYTQEICMKLGEWRWGWRGQKAMAHGL